jgi:hypothetical protein
LKIHKSAAAASTLPFDPALAPAPWAFLVPQSVVHWHAGLPLALRAFHVIRGPHVIGLQFELGNVLVHHHDFLLVEQNAIGKT